MDAVVRRKASRAAWRAAAGSWNRLRSWSEKRAHLQTCTTAKEILAQVGDVPERRAIPTAPVESGYGRKPKVFCPRIVTNIATYNVRTLKAKWRQQELVGFLEKKRIDVCAIQEHRICHSNSSSPSSYTRVLHLPGGWRLVTHTADDSGSGGIGFLVSPIAFKCLDRVEYKSDRVMRLQFSGHTKGAPRTHLVCAYAPTNVADSATKDLFYSQLHQTIDPLPKRDRLFVLGDMNARLDSRFCKFPIHSSASDNGERMAEFMEEQGLFSAQCAKDKPRRQWYTHCGPQGFQSRIDHCLTRRKFASSVLDCQLYRVVAPASDHRLMKIRVTMKLATPKKTNRVPSLDYARLKEAPIAELVESDVCAATGDTPSYELFVAAAKTACETHLPVKPRFVRSKPWLDTDIITARDLVAEAQRTYKEVRSDDSRQKMADATKSLAQLYVDKEEVFYASMASEVEQASKDGKHSAAWKVIDRMTGRKCRQVCSIAADSQQDRLTLWRDHFMRLLASKPPDVALPVLQVHEGMLPIDEGSISLNEIATAASQLKTGKACGMDSIPPELLKLTGIHEILLPVLNQAFETGVVPDEWKVSGIIPIFKKGDASVCANYRGIALMSLAAKLYNRILLNRIQPHVEPLLRPNQNGFRVGRSTVQHILALRRIIEECTVRQECQCVVTFIDFSKAFDSISRTRMEEVLYNYGLSTKIVTAVMSMYSGTAARVVTADGCSADFQVEAGVLQGDTLAPYLFVIVVDYVLRAAIPDDSVGFMIQKRLSRRHPAKYVTDLDFADDIALLSGTMANAQTLLTAVEENAAAVGLHINMKKTEYIRIGDFSGDTHPTLRVSGGEIAEVADFRYLGSWIMSSNKDFVVRRACAYEAANKLWRVWKSGCSRNTKIRVFKATVESVLLYGAETWTLTEQLTSRICGTYSNLLRKALNVHWRDRITNAELYGDLPRADDIIRDRRLHFVGHAARCIKDRYQPVADLVFWQGSGPMRRGQGNRRTFLKTIISDLGGHMTAAEISRCAADRDEWRKRIN